MEDFRFEAGRDQVQEVSSNLESVKHSMNPNEYKETDSTSTTFCSLPQNANIQFRCKRLVTLPRTSGVQNLRGFLQQHAHAPCPTTLCAVNRRSSSNIIVEHDIAGKNSSIPRISMLSSHGSLTARSPIQCATVETAVYPSEPDLKTALEHHNDITVGKANVMDVLDSQPVLPQRRVRSLSQSLANASGGGSPREEWRSSMKQSFVRVSEEERDDSAGGEEVQIRSIHNDGHFNNHRLSKLSIHTNNDEFFYVGGHPPSEGRTSLRSRGTISRQSMLRSSEFLSGTQDDELAAEALGATFSPQSMKSNFGDGGDLDHEDNEIFEDAPQPEQWSRLQEIPTILLNGKRLSGSSNTGSHYITAPEQLRSEEGGGEVLETMSYRSEHLPSEDQHIRSEYSATTTFISTVSTHSSHESREVRKVVRNKQSYSSGSNVVSGTDNTQRSRSTADDSTAQPQSPQQLSDSVVNVHSIHLPYVNLDTKDGGQFQRFTVSRQVLRPTPQNVSDENEPATVHASARAMFSSSANLHASDSHHPPTASRQSLRLSTQNIDDEIQPATAEMYSSKASLHAPDGPQALTASRQSV
ncbi:hypothetical protein OSTOST_03058, partial [Ostertagia ostertagi]